MSDEQTPHSIAGESGQDGPRVVVSTESPAIDLKRDPKRGIVVSRRRKVTLVMLSGGIDSVYTLVKLLRETDDEILAHHVDLINQEDRFRIEGKRCLEIVKHCREHYRDFSFSQSAVDHRGFRFFGYDMVTVGFEAGIVAHSYLDAKGQPVDRWTVGTCTEEGHWEERFKHVEACVAANCFPEAPPKFFLLPMVTKRAEMDYLGEALVDLCWTCRTPVPTEDGVAECGRCKTCELMIEVRRQRADARAISTRTTEPA